MTRARPVVHAMVVVALAGLAACSRQAPSALDTKSPEAERIAGVWWLMFGLAAAVYVVVAGFILVALLRGRGTEDGRRSRISDNHFIWLGGIVVPVVILGVLAVVTVKSTTDLRASAAGTEKPLVVDVVGKRWWWEVRYPEFGIVSANEVRVPVGRPVTVRLRSDNVIHSFWVPQLGGKMDLIPEQTNIHRFTAQQAGEYRGQCAEFCGLQHANMNFLVIAEPPAQFGRWAAQHRVPPQNPANEEAARGQAVFMRSSCAGCHAVRGTDAKGDFGPDLTDFGGRRSIGSLAVPNTPGHLAGWIVDAQSIKPGNLMPPITLEPQEVDDLVAYLQSLR